MKQKLIVIAENDTTHAVRLAVRVQAHGYECQIARNSLDAVAAYLTKKPDLIFIDLDLPNRDGASITRLITAADPYASVILMAADDDHVEQAQSAHTGAFAVLKKPVSPDMIRALLGRASYADSPLQQIPA